MFSIGSFFSTLRSAYFERLRITRSAATGLKVSSITFLQAIPRIVTAAIVLAVGWLVARIVRGGGVKSAAGHGCRSAWHSAGAKSY